MTYVSADGKPVKIRTMRDDGTVEQDEIFKADGTSTTVDHQASENIKEPYDSTMKDEPKYDDPLKASGSN